jgi:peptidoglycan/xylan/chitin deacetylase (PgdA/CDA1 family)
MYRYTSIIIIYILFFIFIVIPTFSLPLPSYYGCSCVVFRIDDIQDYWIQQAQIAVMDLFISKNLTLSVGLIIDDIGNDTILTEKIEEGLDRNLFELALHGWDHEDFTTFDLQQQKDLLKKANEKNQILFGNKSQVFTPPYGKFNNNTLKAMNDLDIKILSSSLQTENDFNEGKDIFNLKVKMINSSSVGDGIYHLPSTVSFYDYKGENRTKESLQDILNKVDDSISKYGYSVITFHPQDFAKLDEEGEFFDIVDIEQIEDLSLLIDTLKLKNISISSFSDIVDLKSSNELENYIK